MNAAKPDRDYLSAAAIVCGGALVLAFVGFYWSGWTRVPITIRFLVGLIAFGVAPGLLMVGPFLSRRLRDIDLGDIVLSVVTCSFSCNLALNIILFALGWSLTRLTHAYVFVQLLAYATWAARRVSRSATSVSTPTPPPAATHRDSKAWRLLFAAAAAVIYIVYVNGAPITNSEELVSIRKLVENPSVRYDNLSYRQGDPSTYLFVPFQIFIGGTSIVARADVSLVYSLFWSVTTALSIFVIARLAFVLFGRTEVAWLAALWMIAIALFDPDSMIYGAGLVVPFPNRYGFAGGVLLPLILLLFWSVLRDPQFQLWRWALLVYVAVEMTFVHARETLLGLGMMVAAFALLAVRPLRNRRQILRIAAVVAITACVLALYKRVNLALAPDLDAYVGAMTEACRKALFQLMADHSAMDLLTIPAPRFADVTVGGSAPIKLGFSTYRVMFIDTWGYKLLARLCLPIALLVLPIYALRARSVAELSVAAVLGALGLVLTSGFLNLFISAVVGNPEILIVYNVIALFSLLVVCGAAWQAGSAIAELWRGAGTVRVSMSMAYEHSTPKTASLRLSTVTAVILPCALLMLWSFTSIDYIASWVGYFSAAWLGTFGTVMLAAPMIAVAYRIMRRDLPLFAPVEPAPPLALFISGSLIVALLMPVVRRSPIWEKNPFTPEYPSYRFSGAFYADYPMLTAPSSKKLDPSPYSLDVIQFLRELPPNRTLLASDALALMERVPHFAAVLSNKGEVAANYIVNTTYLRDYSRSGTKYAIAPFLTDDDGVRLFGKFLSEYHVDVIVVDPAESGAVRQVRDGSSTLRSLLRPAFEKDGYVIYGVERAAAVSAQR